MMLWCSCFLLPTVPIWIPGIVVAVCGPVMDRRYHHSFYRRNPGPPCFDKSDGLQPFSQNLPGSGTLFHFHVFEFSMVLVAHGSVIAFSISHQFMSWRFSFPMSKNVMCRSGWLCDHFMEFRTWWKLEIGMGMEQAQCHLHADIMSSCPSEGEHLRMDERVYVKSSSGASFLRCSDDFEM